MSKKSSVKMYIPQRIHEVVTKLHEDHKASEWSAFCKIIDWKDGYAIVDMFFPNQDNSAGLNTTTQEGLDQFCNWVIENEPTEMSKWKMQIHSHHSMGLFWSGTDHAQNRAWNYGGNKHFFNAVTAYSNVKATKEEYEKQTGSNIGYFGCINFYDIDVEVPMEFIIGMDLNYEGVKNKYDTLVENKKPSLRKIAEGNIEAKLAGFEQYVSKIAKTEYSVEDKDKLVEQELVSLISGFIDEIKDDYRAEIQKCYDDNYIIESQYIKITPDEALRLLLENEVKKTPVYPAKTSYPDNAGYKYSAKIYTYPQGKTPSGYWRDSLANERILFDDMYGKVKYGDDKFFCNITGKYYCSTQKKWLDHSFYDDYYDDEYYQ